MDKTDKTDRTVKSRATLLSLAWGLQLVTQDVSVWFLYPLLLGVELQSSDPQMQTQWWKQPATCETYLTVYTWFCLISTIATGVFYPLSGWLTELTEQRHNSPTVFMMCNASQTILVGCMFVVTGSSPLILCVMWQLVQLINAQAINTTWSLIKSSITDTVSTAKIGNGGDLICDSIETVLGGGILMACLSWSYSHAWALVMGITLSVYIVMTVVSFIMVIQYQSSTTTTVVIPANATTINSNLSNEASTLLTPSASTTTETNQSILVWFVDSLKSLWQTKLARHTLFHCILLTSYSTIVQYPLALKETFTLSNVGDGGHNNDTSSTNATVSRLSNYCHGSITDLYLTAFASAVCYLFGSIVYRVFIIRASAKWFYRVTYPVLSIGLLVVTIVIWYAGDLMPSFAVFVLISVSTIVPYYLTYFDYYLFTTETPAGSYGFVLGVYGALNTVSTTVIQAVYLTKASFGLILGCCCVVLCCCVAYSFYISSMNRIVVLSSSTMTVPEPTVSKKLGVEDEYIQVDVV